MSDFTVSVGLDPRDLLQGFAEIGRTAQRAGGEIGKNLGAGLDTTNANIRALQNQIKTLTQTRAQLKVDSTEFKSAQAQIDLLQSKLQKSLGERLKLQVDASAVTAAASGLEKVGQIGKQAGAEAGKGLGDGISKGAGKGSADTLRELNTLKSNIIREFKDLKAQGVDPTSDAYKSLQARLAEVNQQIKSIKVAPPDLPEAADKFRLLDGVIQGVAFSLSNALIDGAASAVRAVGDLIGNYAKLDTEIRKAAAAGGEAGGYGKLSAAIDQVGIEAAGTQQQVAELTTELVRGGLTVDQATKALGGIVRGAEATATSYDRMGQIVTATLTAFGLEASQTTRVVDALVQGANSSATDVSGLGEAFKTSAPAAKLLGISVEGLATAVGLFTNAGITAGEAGTTLRNGLSQLGSAAPQTGAGMSKLTGQAKEAADVMKTLKLDIYNANGTLKPMETVLLQLKGAFDKLGPAARIQLASKLFGGTDDGTKWLAVLGQSEEKIKAMASAMSNAKGATDRNRDAMQGFQLTIQQLTGTLDSLGNNVGKIAAGALLPLVNAANTVVGAIAALPGPVKDTVIAMGLLAGSAVGAAAAFAVFQRVAEMGVAQKIGLEITDLAKGIRDNLTKSIDAAKAVIPGLLAQLQMIGEVNIGEAMKTAGTAIRSVFVGSIEAAKAALISFQAYLKSADFASFIAGARAATATLAPLALAVGGVAAAIASYNAVTADSRKVAESAAAGQDELTAALTAAGIKTGELTTLNGPFARALQDGAISVEGLLAPLRGIPGVGDLVVRSLKGIWDALTVGFPLIKASIDAFNFLAKSLRDSLANANATQGIQNASIALNNLQAQAGAAQNAAGKLFAELQAAGGPPNTQQQEQIKRLSAALEGAKNQAAKLQEQYTLLAAAARNSGNEKLAKEYEALAVAAGQDIKLSDVRLGQLASIGKAAQQQTGLTQEQIKVNQQRAQTELEINKAIASRPVDNQIAVGQQLLGLAKAISDVEQSRYGVTRSALQFELQQAEKRGASEDQIGAIKKRIEENDRAALQAKYQALLQQQNLEQAMLRLAQEKARIDANFDVLKQKQSLLEIQVKIKEAQNKGDRDSEALLRSQYELQRQVVGAAEDKIGILAQTQPLERAAANLQGEAARNGLQAQAAAIGYKFALDGSLRPANALVELQDRISTATGLSADDQQRYAGLAERAGLAIGKAADGTTVLGRSQGDVNRAVEEMNRQLNGAKGGYDAASRGAVDTTSETDKLKRALFDANVRADEMASRIADAGNKARGAKGETDKLKSSLDGSAGPADAVAQAFIKVGNKAPAAVQGSRDFAGWLSQAKVFAENIRDIKLENRMAAVRDRTREAAIEAGNFFSALERASRLPGARWAGGPVEAGSEYRINELGQEAFLSAGRLSLINAPQNSIWRAPSDGVVIPAGITARLQAQGAMPAAGGGSVGTAELAIEVGKLRQEVGNLARRDWNVHVTQRTGPTGSQVMRTLLS